MTFDAVIVAAGSSTRFGAKDKLTADLCGRPVVAWSLAAFGALEELARLVVVTGGDNVEAMKRLVHHWAPNARALVVTGGARRRDSVEAGLRACSSRYVAIHDGARPLITPALVDRVVQAANGRPGAIVASPLTDTVKEVTGGLIVGHPDRSRLWAAQTPQVVLRQAWLDAAAASDNDETDDASMLSRLGMECVVVEGHIENLKVTRPADLLVAAELLRQRMEGAV